MDIFEVKLNNLQHIFVNDHKVSGKCILPLAAYVELIIANFEHWNPNNGIIIKRMKTIAPMKFKDMETKKIRIKYDFKGGVYNFFVSSMDENSNWISHVEGEIRENNEPLKLEYEYYSINNGKQVSKDKVYELYRQAQLQYGNFYKTIEKILINNKDVYADIKLNNTGDSKENYFFVNPALLDGAFQAAGFPSFYENEDDIFLPYYIEELIYYKPLNESCISMSKQRVKNFDDSPIKKYDVYICDKNKEPYIQVKGYTIKALATEIKRKKELNSVSEELQNYIPNNSFKVENWMELKKVSKSNISFEGESWIIVSDNNGISDSFKSDILNKGINPLIIKLGNKFVQETEKSFILKDNSLNDCREAIKYFFSKFKNINRIIHLSTLNNCKVHCKTTSNLNEKLNIGLISIFNIAKVLTEIKVNKNIYLNVITSNVSKILEDDEICCEHSAILGIVKSVNMENNGTICSLLDIGEFKEESLSKTILEALYTKNITVHTAIRNDKLYIPYSKTVEIPKINGKNVDIKDGGIYLITGGCGAIGLSFAEYLATYKNVKIVLLNRTKYPQSSQWDSFLKECQDGKLKSKISKLIKIRDNGAKVYLYSADICDYRQMEQVVGDIEKQIGRINGVIHGSGLLRDKLVCNMSLDDFYYVIKPKIFGLWILNDILKEKKLDFFLLCSSITSRIGNKGQCNYSAANAYLDAFAVKNHKNIKKVISINWSTWSEGMASQEVINANEKIGLISISNNMGIEAFKRILECNYRNIVFVPSQQEKFDFNKTYLKVLGVSEDIFNISETDEKDYIKKYEFYDKQKIQDMLMEILSIKLKLDLTEFDINTSFIEYGIDSINSAEIVGVINDRFGLEAEGTLFFEYKNIDELSNYISENSNLDINISKMESKTFEQKDMSISLDDNNKRILENIRDAENTDNLKKVYKVDKNYKLEIEEKLVAILSDVLSIDKSDIDIFEGLMDYGIDSIIVGSIVEKIKENIDIDLEPTIFFEYKNISELSDYISQLNCKEKVLKYQEKELEATDSYKDNFIKNDDISHFAYIEENEIQENFLEMDSNTKNIIDDNDIAVIGVSCRFPDASNVEGFWRNLVSSESKIKEIPYDRIDWKGYIDNLKDGDADKLSCRVGGFIKDIDKFDATFFGISPNEARAMDPQQRIMLELAWEVFESSGYINKIFNTNTGVFVGSSNNYYQDILNKSDDLDNPYSFLGNMNAVIANRISYFFGLHGPSEHISTLCSSSLVAITAACDSIKNGACSLAIAGGIRLLIPPEHYIGFSKLNILSKDGKCKAFDKNASGFISAEGGGFVLLKSAAKAIEDGDNIYGIIKGYAVNNNGKSNGIMAPNPKAQEQLLLDAYEKTGVNPSDLWYLEANGTGTLYGDSLEIKALNNVFKKYTERKGFCAIGSVKTNIGHAEPASGMAGILKILMSFKEGVIPPTLNFNEANKMAQLEQSPFYISDKVVKYDKRNTPKIAAMSCFGMGGTNAHIILQEPIIHDESFKERSTCVRRYRVIPLAAKTKSSLLNIVNDLKMYISQDGFDNILHNSMSNIAYTLGIGRMHFNRRIGLICGDIDQLRDKLEIINIKGIENKIEKHNIYTNLNIENKNKIRCLFLFPSLKKIEYKNVLENIKEILKEEETFRIYYKDFIKEASLNDSTSIIDFFEKEKVTSNNSLTKKQLEIAIMGYQYAMAVMFMKWGIKPEMCIGDGSSTILSKLIDNSKWTDVKYVFNEIFNNQIDLKDSAYEEISIGNFDAVIEFGLAIEGLSSIKKENYEGLWITAASKRSKDCRFIHEVVGKLYSLGLDINWNNYFQNKGEIIELPAYPFDYKSYWVKTKNQSKIVVNDDSLVKINNVYKAIDNSTKTNYEAKKIEKENAINQLDHEKIKDKLNEIFIEAIVKNLGYDKEDIDINETLDSLGFDSIISGKVVNQYEKIFSLNLDPTDLFQYNTISKYTEYLIENYKDQFLQQISQTELSLKKEIKENDKSLNCEIDKCELLLEDKDLGELNNKKKVCCYSEGKPCDIAIIGLAGKFPGTDEPSVFFQHLCEGQSEIREIPKERWNIADFYSSDAKELGKTNCRYGSFLNDVDKFDPAFFGISVNKAPMIDPQQRLMLEVAWRAVEDAGYSNNRISKTKTGVYIGICNNEYIHLKDKDYKKLSPHLASGNTFSIVANRISYTLDINGPSMAIDAACSSSMIALHNACKDILLGECEMGLVGGINLTLSPVNQIIFSKAMLLSPDGVVRSFDEDANGYIRGEGVGAVLLKPLSKAIDDGDNIYAVIKGSHVTHSGQSNGLNTPNPIEQKKTIIEAYKKSGIDMETISYIEAHASGTHLGDYSEFRALSDAFKHVTDKKQFCAISSIKGNIGHTESASGILALIKVIMALKYKKLPPLINFKKKNSKINLVNSSFYINDKLSTWNGIDGLRRAAINCLGFGGTNAHLVVEEYIDKSISESNSNKNGYLVTLSSQQKSSLNKMCDEFMSFIDLEENKNNIENICYTLACRRSHYKYRIALESDTIEGIKEKLNLLMKNQFENSLISQANNKKQPSYVFVINEAMHNVSDILSFYNYFPVYKRYFEEIFNELPNYYRDKVQYFMEKDSLETDIELNAILSVLHSCCLFKLFLKLGVNFKGVCGIGIGIFSMLTISGILKIKDLDKFIDGKVLTINTRNIKENYSLFAPYCGRLIKLNGGNITDFEIKNLMGNLGDEALSNFLEEQKCFELIKVTEVESLNLFRMNIANLYVNGANINWNEYYVDKKYKTVNVPGYIFNNKRYWHM